jgi:hypothetical protein
MLTVASRIPDAASRDQFADTLAHKARITEEVVRAEIRRAAVSKATTVAALEAGNPAANPVKAAEKGLIWALVHDPAAALAALSELDPGDLDGLATTGILGQARSLQDWKAESLPGSLLKRLNSLEAELVEEIGRYKASPADPAECARALKRLRYDRERAAVQREIDRLQREGADGYEHEIVALWDRKRSLLQQIEALLTG